MILKWIINSFAALNANNRPGEIASAIALGITLAMIPAGNLTWVLLLALTFFLKINFGVEMIVIALFKPMASLADPLFDAVGYKILTAGTLESFYTKLYNTPLVPYTGFNNTAVAGSIIVMGVLFVPLWIACRKLIALYRAKLRDRFLSSSIVKKIAALPIVSKAAMLFSKANKLRNFRG
ncbi:MAG: TIGR03546 family protein [Spirochaetia bacterium]|jgi:uncharacterized protein (TIGR03546 family)|nr:TIGR03546 family protein [Spirochaetia bacterium]